MLNKLRDMATNKVLGLIEPHFGKQLEAIKGLSPADINDDSKYETLAIKPAFTAINAQTGMALGKLPKAEDKFRTMMFNVRDELIRVEGNKVSLVEGFAQKLPTVLLEGLKKG